MKTILAYRRSNEGLTVVLFVYWFPSNYLNIRSSVHMKHLKNFSQTYSQHIPPMSEYFQSLNFDDFQQELSVFVFFVHWFNGGWVSVIKKGRRHI